MLGTARHGCAGHLLVLTGDITGADDLAKAALVVAEQDRRDVVAPPVARTALCGDGDLQGLGRAVKTSGSSFRCNVPDGHTTSGSACSASS